MSFSPRTSLGNFLNSQWSRYAVSRTGVGYPNCFTYATARISEIVGYNQPLDPQNRKVNGAQDLWGIHHPNFTNSATPKAGALMIWRSGQWGHVAVCENSTGTAWSQSNYGGKTFEYITGNPNGYCGMTFLGYLIHKDLPSTSTAMTYEQMTDEEWAVRFNNDTPIIIHKDSTTGGSIGTFVRGEVQCYTKKGAWGGHRWIGWQQNINGVNYKCICAISGSENRGQDMWVELVDPSTINKAPATPTPTPTPPAPAPKPDYSKNVKMYGADISKHQGDFDVSKDGFYIIRASYGTNTDENFLTNVNKCKTANKKFGVYCYSYALDNEQAESEADYIIKLMQDNNIVPDLGVWYDMEDADHYKEKRGALTAENCTNFTKIFVNKLKNAGYYTGVYTSLSWVGNYVKDIDYPLWLACWGKNDGNLNGDYSNVAVMLQYTSTPYDKNVLYIDAEKMKSNPKPVQGTPNENAPEVGNVKLDEVSIELLRENSELLKTNNELLTRLASILKI